MSLSVLLLWTSVCTHSLIYCCVNIFGSFTYLKKINSHIKIRTFHTMSLFAARVCLPDCMRMRWSSSPFKRREYARVNTNREAKTFASPAVPHAISFSPNAPLLLCGLPRSPFCTVSRWQSMWRNSAPIRPNKTKNDMTPSHSQMAAAERKPVLCSTATGREWGQGPQIETTIREATGHTGPYTLI